MNFETTTVNPFCGFPLSRLLQRTFRTLLALLLPILVENNARQTPQNMSRYALAGRLVDSTPTDFFAVSGRGFMAEPFWPAPRNNVQAISAAEDS